MRSRPRVTRVNTCAALRPDRRAEGWGLKIPTGSTVPPEVSPDETDVDFRTSSFHKMRDRQGNLETYVHFLENRYSVKLFPPDCRGKKCPMEFNYSRFYKRRSDIFRLIGF